MLKLYFEPTFDELSYDNVMKLYNSKFKLYNALYPFEFINMYRTVLVIDNLSGVLYINPYNDETILMSDRLSYDNYDTTSLYFIADAVILNGKIIKNRFN